MTTIRQIQRLSKGQPTIEGAGVHLRRAFGFNEVPLFDPFLLLDDFRSNEPARYLAGFPWHPHRGIETITYVLAGAVEHGDSLGNQGLIGPGDVQWMTAGSGIIHQEMPRGDAQGRLQGFQLWANLPASHKMMNPRYRDLTQNQIPLVKLPGGAQIRVIAGEVAGTRGPVDDIMIEPEYLDIELAPGGELRHPTRPGHTVLAYVIAGQASFAPGEPLLANTSLALYADGEAIAVSTQAEPVRFLLISGKPLNEPVAWQGPIVMNTQAELRQAFEEYRQGSFIKFRG